MKFIFEEVETLPAMAWCLKIVSGASQYEVLHGKGVDCRSDFFYEGCWNGELSSTALISADISAATGACLDRDKVILICPSNTLARLYAIKKGNALWFSNSMAFVTVAADEEIQRDYAHYQEDISSVIDGLEKSIKSIPLQSGLRIEFYFHCNVEVTKALDVRLLRKKEPPPFTTFSEYRQFLSRGLVDLVRNANAAGRKIQFKPIVSISKGYDSVTCAVLAREAGCEDALTMFDPESTDPNADSGVDIAKVLGLNITAYSRVAYKKLSAEWEFFSVGTGGEDIFFSAMESMFAGRMFISGFHGDKVWDKNPSKISDQIIRGDPSGADLEEFRLRVGFVHVAVPFFGCRAHASINAISNSEEMAAWSVGGDYDRPICRRIAEEAGVQRLSFGQKKRVMSRSFGTKGLEWYLGSASLKDFREYTIRQPQVWRKTDVMLHGIARLFDGVASGAGRISYQVEKNLRKPMRSLRRYQKPLDETRQLFHWSFKKMTNRYQTALKRS